MKLREIENYYITKASYGDKTISNVDMLEFCFNELIIQDIEFDYDEIDENKQIRIELSDKELEFEEIERERISRKLFYVKFQVKNEILYFEIMNILQNEKRYLEELGEYKRKIIDLLGKRAILIDEREHLLKSEKFLYIDGEKHYLNILELIGDKNLYTVRNGEGEKDERAILILAYLKNNLVENISIDKCLEMLYKEVATDL